jgi:diguanylate cyclase (GGDEF)-like protein
VGDSLAGGPIFPPATVTADLGGLASVGGRACLFARQPIGDRHTPDGFAVFVRPIDNTLLGELAKTTGVGITVIDLPLAGGSAAASSSDHPARATVAAGTLFAETSLQDSLGRPIARLRVSGSVAELDRAASNMWSAYLVQLCWLLGWGLVTFAAVYLLFIRPLSILVRRLSAPDVAGQRSGLATGLFAEAGILATKFAGVMGRIVELSQIDGLTGLINRRQFQILLDHEFNMSHRHGSPLAMMMIDVDRFKRVNDTFGHLVGDEVLAMVARAVAESTRRSDVCARYGGEEFAVILPRTTMEQALPIAERIRDEIARRVVLRNPDSIKVTASIGVASIPEMMCARPEHLVDAADRALYLAKRLGRDRAVLASELPPTETALGPGPLAHSALDVPPATGSSSASAAG